MKLLSLAVAAALFAATSAARADTIQTFNVTGTGGYTGQSVSGTLTIDTTIGYVDSASLYEGSVALTKIASQGIDSSGSFCSDACYVLDLTDATVVFHNDSASLAGYTGSPIGVLGNDVYNATATLAVAPTPEPSTLVLLLTGFVALAGLSKFRRTPSVQPISAS
jgi:hypothetical protein